MTPAFCTIVRSTVSLAESTAVASCRVGDDIVTAWVTRTRKDNLCDDGDQRFICRTWEFQALVCGRGRYSVYYVEDFSIASEAVAGALAELDATYRDNLEDSYEQLPATLLRSSVVGWVIG